LSDASILRTLRAHRRFLLSTAAFIVLLIATQLVEGQTADFGVIGRDVSRDADVPVRSPDNGPASCHDLNALCLTVAFPESVLEPPEALVISLEAKRGSSTWFTAPPALCLERPRVVAERSLSVVLDARVTGTYRVGVVLYMPGGGVASSQPQVGVDYAASSAPLMLTGAPVSLVAPLDLALVE
jgi:hypothetical protein